MSTISKSGIAAGQIIKSEHLLRVIEALSGDTINDIVITGSLQATSGHITKDLTVDGVLYATASYIVTSSYQFLGDQQITGSLKVSGSIYGVGSFYMNGNKMFNYGAFSDSTTQSGSANVSESFKYNTTDLPDGVSVYNDARGLPTGLQVSYAGIYNLQFSAQIQQGAGSADIAIWFKKNNVNIPNSATYLTVPSNQKAVAAWNIVVDCAAGDHLEISYQSNSSATTYPFIAASGNIPAVPSIIATVTQIA